MHKALALTLAGCLLLGGCATNLQRVSVEARPIKGWAGKDCDQTVEILWSQAFHGVYTTYSAEGRLKSVECENRPGKGLAAFDKIEMYLRYGEHVEKKTCEKAASCSISARGYGTANEPINCTIGIFTAGAAQEKPRVIGVAKGTGKCG